MDIITKHAEEKLCETLKAYWETNKFQRCAYFRFSGIQHKPNNWFQAFVDIIDEHFDEDNGQVFLCHDGDVFILMRFLTTKNLPQLLAHAAGLFAPAPLPEGLATIFEISGDWVKLKNISERKQELAIVYKRKVAKKLEEERAQKERQGLIQKFTEENLLATLAQKRNERTEIDVLIVEDDIFSQRLVKNAINTQCNVIPAKDGKEALTAYMHKAPDIVFLDIGLPDMTGHEVLSKIFEIDPEAFVVMLSGNGDRVNILQAIDQGAKGFVGKPFTKEKLLDYIQKSPFVIAKKTHAKKTLEIVQ